MPEVQITEPYQDTEVVRTREEMHILGGEGTNHAYNKAEPPGPEIDYLLEFVPNVLVPAKDEVHADFDNIGRAASLVTERWLDEAAGGLPPTIPDAYNSSLSLNSSVSHLHDPDVRGMLNALSLELRTAKVAELNAIYDFDPPWLPGDVVLDWDFGDVDFPLFTYPIGTYGNRLVEVVHSVSSEFQDRDGDPTGISTPTADPLAFWAIPVETPGAEDPDAGELVQELDGSWSCDVLEARGEEDARVHVNDGNAVQLISAAGGDDDDPAVVTREDIDDDWWDAHTWTVTNPITDYPTRGVPLAGGYEFTFIPDVGADIHDTDAIGTGHQGFVVSTAELWFETDWTPPRHRFRYFLEQTGVPPRRIFGRSDGATHGAARGLGGRNTVQSGNRTLGSIL
jgi:hypothetical protein